MMRPRVILPALLAGLFGVLWGCTPPAPPAPPVADKGQEAKLSKLEQELKFAQESAAKYAAQVRAEQAKLAAAEKERDDLALNLKARTTERDGTQAQFDAFRKNLKELIGQADAAASPRVGDGAVTVLERK